MLRPAYVRLRALWRLLRVLGHALRGWWTIRHHFPGLTAAAREQEVQRWAQGMLTRMGIVLEVQGLAHVQSPALLVSNHVSWLDILVLHASRFCRFVSKSDVGGWPLVGTLATGAGTLYIERGSRRDAQRVVQLMAQSLQRGEVLALFPEGTTSDGHSVLPFHANLLQSAIDSGVPALPLALAYREAGDERPSRAAAYIDHDSLAGSIWRVLKAQRLQVRLVYGQAEQAGTRARREWAVDLQQQVLALLKTDIRAPSSS